MQEKLLKTVLLYKKRSHKIDKMRYRAFPLVVNEDSFLGYPEKINKSKTKPAVRATSSAFCVGLRNVRGIWDVVNVKTVPYTIQTKHRQIKVTLKPAPASVGLSKAPINLWKILVLAGIDHCLVRVTDEHEKRDVYLKREPFLH